MFSALTVFAYIDVGVGSMLLQASLAGFFAVLIFSRQLKNRCLAYLRREKKNVAKHEQ